MATTLDLHDAAARIRSGKRQPHGSVWDPFPKPFHPGVSPGSLRSLLDVVEGTGAAKKAGRAPKGPGWWVGLVSGEPFYGYVIFGDVVEEIALSDLLEPYPVIPVLSDEILEFKDGYDMGIVAGQSAKDVSQKSKAEVPTWYGRGFMKGFDDHDVNNLRWHHYAPFNEVFRKMALRYPEEHRIQLDEVMREMHRMWPGRHPLLPAADARLLAPLRRGRS